MKPTIQITNSSALDAITRMAEIGMNPTPMLDIVGGRLTNRVRLCFKTGTDPYGKAWAKINHRQGQPLRDTGRLNRSITHQVTSTGKDHALEIGTNTVYARLHQFGGQGKKAQVSAFSRIQTMAWGKKITPRQVQVKAHTKTMNQKARPFLPNPEQGLPEAWEKSATQAIIKTLNQVIGGSA